MKDKANVISHSVVATAIMDNVKKHQKLAKSLKRDGSVSGISTINSNLIDAIIVLNSQQEEMYARLFWTDHFGKTGKGDVVYNKLRDSDCVRDMAYETVIWANKHKKLPDGVNEEGLGILEKKKAHRQKNVLMNLKGTGNKSEIFIELKEGLQKAMETIDIIKILSEPSEKGKPTSMNHVALLVLARAKINGNETSLAHMPLDILKKIGGHILEGEKPTEQDKKFALGVASLAINMARENRVPKKLFIADSFVDAVRKQRKLAKEEAAKKGCEIEKI